MVYDEWKVSSQSRGTGNVKRNRRLPRETWRRTVERERNFDAFNITGCRKEKQKGQMKPTYLWPNPPTASKELKTDTIMHVTVQVRRACADARPNGMHVLNIKKKPECHEQSNQQEKLSSIRCIYCYNLRVTRFPKTKSLTIFGLNRLH